MLSQNDLEWIATTSTELKTILQQIAHNADPARQHKGDQTYVDLIGEQIEAASKMAQALFDRVTSKILEAGAAKAADAPSEAAPGRTAKKHGTPDKSSAKTSPAKTAPAAIPAQIKVLNETGNRELLLLVEDEKEVAELAALMLTEEGYKVIHARDGFEALKIYQQINKKIGLVILDFFLPVMDGDAVFDELCALNPNVAVVLSSGFGEQSKVNSMLARGLRGFIPKPYTREKLLLQIRSILDAARDSTR